MIYWVVFSPEFDRQLVELYRYIAENASPETALNFTQSLLAYLVFLGLFQAAGL